MVRAECEGYITDRPDGVRTDVETRPDLFAAIFLIRRNCSQVGHVGGAHQRIARYREAYVYLEIDRHGSTEGAAASGAVVGDGCDGELSALCHVRVARWCGLATLIEGGVVVGRVDVLGGSGGVVIH
eukprot:Pompholyxophrys_punicea_v1_NODE_13_length_6352_cov_32.548833.p5 type:complete len:127 gc:universal NODE_13_length_6352_cov_32.548833:1876-2256(+)